MRSQKTRLNDNRRIFEEAIKQAANEITQAQTAVSQVQNALNVQKAE